MVLADYYLVVIVRKISVFFTLAPSHVNDWLLSAGLNESRVLLMCTLSFRSSDLSSYSYDNFCDIFRR